MPLPTEYNLPKTKDAYEFENIVCDVCIRKFGRNFQKFGRTGQKQFGVDILSIDQGELICVQCKNYVLSSNDVKTIIERALKFNRPVSKLIIATASSTDTKLQEQILEINCRSDLKFEINIMFWDEISNIVSQFDDLLSKYYPKINHNSIDWLVSEFNQLMSKYNVFGFMNVDPVIGMPDYYPEQIDLFYFELGQKLMQVNNLQQHPKFIDIKSFRDMIYGYSSYLSTKLFFANNMYTIQNYYDLIDVTKENSKIKSSINNYKKEIDKLYGKINENCSIFLVTQYI